MRRRLLVVVVGGDKTRRRQANNSVLYEFLVSFTVRTHTCTHARSFGRPFEAMARNVCGRTLQPWLDVMTILSVCHELPNTWLYPPATLPHTHSLTPNMLFLCTNLDCHTSSLLKSTGNDDNNNMSSRKSEKHGEFGKCWPDYGQGMERLEWVGRGGDWQ